METQRKERIDWEAVHERLKKIGQSSAEDPKYVDKVQRARAKRLAERKRSVLEEVRTPIIAFAVGEERFAIELVDLLEVLPHHACTAVPGGPPELLGLIGHLGEIRPVIDLARLLAIKEDEHQIALKGYLLMLRRGKNVFGVRVRDVENIYRQVFREAGAADGQKPYGPFIKGIADDASVLLNIEAISKKYC